MPHWKPKTPHEKFLKELKKLDKRIGTKKAEIEQLEREKKQIQMVVAALAEEA